MRHSEETVNTAIGQEPPDRTILIVETLHGEWRAIRRSDTEAKGRVGGDVGGQHWFHADLSSPDPMRLYEHLKYARAVYRLGETVASFR